MADEDPGLCPKCHKAFDFDYMNIKFCDKCNYICVVMSSGFRAVYKKGVKTEVNKLLGYTMGDIVLLFSRLYQIREDYDLDEGEMSGT